MFRGNRLQYPRREVSRLEKKALESCGKEWSSPMDNPPEKGKRRRPCERAKPPAFLYLRFLFGRAGSGRKYRQGK